MSTQKKKTPPDNKTTIKRFLFTVEEYFRFCSFYSNEQKLTDNAKELKYISLQTKLILIRKYESHTDACYLGEVLKAAITEYPDCKTRWDTLRKKLENIEHNQLEVLLSDGTTKNMHMAIEDVMYGLYLHGDDNKIADLLKPNMTTYLFAVEKYVSF